jgi:hypothetical protein
MAAVYDNAAAFEVDLLEGADDVDSALLSVTGVT